MEQQVNVQPSKGEIEYYSNAGVKVTSQYLIVPPHTWPISLFRPVQPEVSGSEYALRLFDRNGQQVHLIESDNAQRIQLIAEAINRALAESSMPLTAVSAQSPIAAYGQAQPVTVVNFNMPFWALVGLMVKMALASIPAMIILAILMAIIWGVLGRMFAAILSNLR